MAEMTVNANGVDVSILKDTVIYVSVSPGKKLHTKLKAFACKFVKC